MERGREDILHASSSRTITKGLFSVLSFRLMPVTALISTDPDERRHKGLRKLILPRSPFNLAQPQPRLGLKDLPAKTARTKPHSALCCSCLRQAFSLHQFTFQPKRLNHQSAHRQTKAITFRMNRKPQDLLWAPCSSLVHTIIF